MKIAKIVALVLLFAMLLCGCNGGGGNPTTGDTEPKNENYVVKFVDDDGNPVSGIITQFVKKDGSQNLILSEADGTITVSADLFENKFTILSLTGYTAEKMEYELNAENMVVVLLNKENKGDSNVTYTVTVVDQHGNPVSGVVVQICDEENCKLPMTTDENGKASAAYAPSVYHVTLNSLPAGYSSETTEFYFNDKTELTITINAD